MLHRRASKPPWLTPGGPAGWLVAGTSHGGGGGSCGAASAGPAAGVRVGDASGAAVVAVAGSSSATGLATMRPLPAMLPLRGRPPPLRPLLLLLLPWSASGLPMQSRRLPAPLLPWLWRPHPASRGLMILPVASPPAWLAGGDTAARCGEAAALRSASARRCMSTSGCAWRGVVRSIVTHAAPGGGRWQGGGCGARVRRAAEHSALAGCHGRDGPPARSRAPPFRPSHHTLPPRLPAARSAARPAAMNEVMWPMLGSRAAPRRGATPAAGCAPACTACGVARGPGRTSRSTRSTTASWILSGSACAASRSAPGGEGRPYASCPP